MRRQTVPVIQMGRSPEGMAKTNPLTILYDGKTGRFVLYDYWSRTRTWWGHRFGHIQERIPAAVYGMCPDFPSAQSLGLKVNDAQTSPNYHDLVKQEPGRRVRRPDLVMAPER